MPKKVKKIEKNIKNTEIQPLMVSGSDINHKYTSEASQENSKIRRNASSTIQRTDKYKNIEDGLIPFRYSAGIKNESNVSIRDAVIL